MTQIINHFHHPTNVQTDVQYFIAVISRSNKDIQQNQVINLTDEGEDGSCKIINIIDPEEGTCLKVLGLVIPIKSLDQR